LADHARFEQGLLKRLQGRLSLPTPTLLGQGEHDGWCWTRMTQLPGTLLLHRWSRLSEGQRVALLRRLGAVAREVQALPVGEQARLSPPWPEFIARQRAGCLARQQRTGLPAHLLAQLPAFLDGPLPDETAAPVLLTGEFTPMNLLVDADDRLSGLLDFGVEHNIVRKSGAWYTYDGDQLGQGKENSRKYLIERPELANEIELKILTALGIGDASSVDA
jgi:hygromycin-B 7''-O-kinase